MTLPFIKSVSEQKSMLRIYVIAGMSKNEVIGEFGDPVRLKLKINAIAEDGKANKEIISYLSKLIKIPKASIEIIRGDTSRSKDLYVLLSAEDLNVAISKHLDK